MKKSIKFILFFIILTRVQFQNILQKNYNHDELIYKLLSVKNAQNMYSVYINPSENLLNIKAPEPIVNQEIYNVLGQIIMTKH